jgi:two-component system chemotaxis response regulator CheB
MRSMTARSIFEIIAGERGASRREREAGGTAGLASAWLPGIGNLPGARPFSVTAGTHGDAMGNHDIVAVGTSAGGVEALLALVEGLPAGLPACVLVTLHITNRPGSELDRILGSAAQLPVSFAGDGEPARRGHIYIAPPDRHLLLDGDTLRLGNGPRENNARPAIDPMLRSAAVCCGGRTIGAVLTGTLADGASGLWAVDRCGGISVVQDPHDADPGDADDGAQPGAPGPRGAAGRPRAAAGAAGRRAGGPSKVHPLIAALRGRGRQDRRRQHGGDGPDRATVGAGLPRLPWEIDEGELVRYRCHVGHTYTAELMSVALDENLRRALASAQRALEERVSLAQRLERQAAKDGHRLLRELWTQRAGEYERELGTIRDSIRRVDAIAAVAEAGGADADADAAE